MKLIFLPEARQDQRDAVTWYRNESLELAQRFLRERTTVLERIAKTPQQFPFVVKDRQRALLSVFPYSIIFLQMPAFILIVAVAHSSRHPNYWHDRPIPGRVLPDTQ